MNVRNSPRPETVAREAEQAPLPPRPAPSAGVLGKQALLGEGARPRRLARVLFAIVAALLVLGAGLLGLRLMRPSALPQYTTEPVRRGDLTVTVAATGALTPVNQVDVGSELSGIIEAVLVDDNNLVAKGQVLARLDTSRLQDQVASGEAALASAKSSLQLAQATGRETDLNAQRLHRLYDLTHGDAPATADIEAADAAHERAVASIASAKGSIGQAEAALRTSRTNLTKAVIRSPIGGVVLSRKAEPGQTVAASLQAPVLFTLAEDMRRMELHVDIDEADVGEVREGMTGAFTVDAYPTRSYQAKVTRVGLGSQTKEGVVTYTGVLAVDNADLTLRPGMTANAEIISERRPDVLLVPEAALRFRPPASSQPSATLANALTPRMPRFGAPPVRRAANVRAQQLWVLRDGKPAPLTVKVGSTNGRETEVSGAGLSAGMRVITGSARPS